MKTEKTRVLFVCMGNICRSPAGENVMRHLLEDQGLEDQFELDSAGTINMHAGNRPDDRMRKAAENRGISMQGRARQVIPRDFEKFDWILAMDDENYHELLEVQALADNPTARLVKFCEFCEQHDDEYVPDPYYGGTEGFEHVLDLLQDGCAGFIKSL